MTGLELLEKHPHTAEVVKAWFVEQMIESLKDETVPDEFKDFMREQGVQYDKLAVMIDANPRMLLDVFDENDVIIIIKYHENFGFTWAVEEADDQSFYKTRKEAELSAIEVAFDILENKLKPVLEDGESNIATDDSGDDQVHTE
jgi:hypothetical protein